MADTTSNHNRSVATKGTGHVPMTTGATDVCQGPQPPAPYPNNIASTKLAPNNTSTTTVDNKEIWIESGDTGLPGQSDPPHPPHATGVASGKPHKGEASPTSVSTDLITEGDGVVRTNDSTTQNSGNTMGMVDGSALGEGENQDEAFLALKCAIIELEGKNTPSSTGTAHGGLTVGGEGGVVRELGWPGEEDASVEAYYLEVLTGGTLDFISTREDQTIPARPKDPSCPRTDKTTGENHTSWQVKHQDPWRDKTETFTGKELQLKGDWTKYGPTGAAGAAVTGSQSAISTIANGAAQEAGGAGAKLDVEGFLKHWRARKDPGVVTVTAAGCSGTKQSVIQVYPAGVAEISISADFDATVNHGGGRTSAPADEGATIAKFAAIFEKLKRVKQVIDTIQRFGGSDTSAAATRHARTEAARRGGSALTKKSAGFGITLEYVELKETKTGYYGDTLSRWMVHYKWAASLTFTFFDITLSFTIPLAQFLTALGPAAAGVVRLLRIRADLVLSLRVALSIDVAFGRDEYEFATAAGGSATLNFTFTVALRLSVANVNLMTLSASVPVNIIANFRNGEKPEVWVTFQLTGNLQLNLNCTFFEGSRWFQRGPYTYTPEWSKVRYAGTVVPLLTVK